MLQYNFKPIFALRAITRPFAFLRQNGFSNSFAAKVTQNKVKVLNNRELERLCLVFDCTPNELLEWVPDEGLPVDDKHSLHKLLASSRIINISKSLSNLPIDKLKEVYDFLNEKLEESDNELM